MASGVRVQRYRPAWYRFIEDARIGMAVFEGVSGECALVEFRPA